MPGIKTCPGCGGPVRCLSETVEQCECMRISLSPDAIDLIRLRYQDCLCTACLAAIAEEAAAPGNRTGQSTRSL